jgi:hypothetical protein
MTGVRCPIEAQDFPSSLCGQTSSEAHTAFCTLATGDKARPGRDADHSPLSSAEVKERVGAISSLPLGTYIAIAGQLFIIPHILYANYMMRTFHPLKNYKHRGPGFDSRALLRIFLRDLGLERGPLSLVIG